MREKPMIDVDLGTIAGHQQQAQKALQALPAETMTAFRRDHELMRAASAQELKRLIAKHGDTHPRVREKMAMAEHDKALSEAFEREADRVEKAIQFHESDQMVVHGHVSDHTGRPAPKARLELVEERSGKAVGKATADRLGYFRIAIASGVTRAPTDTTALRPSAEPAQDRDLHLNLRVTGEEEAPLRQIIAQPGTAVYVDVVMTESVREKG